MLPDCAKIIFLRTLLRGEILCKLDTFSVKVRSTNIAYLNHIILGLGMYFFPVNALSNQKPSMHHGTRKRHKQNMRNYAACIIDLNEYLAAFPGAKTSDQIGETELNEIFLNSMPNFWSIVNVLLLIDVKILNAWKLRNRFMKAFQGTMLFIGPVRCRQYF